MNFKNHYIYEGFVNPIQPELYHGRKIKDKDFRYDFVGGEAAIDQSGPGFYFTTDKDDAWGYAAPDGVIITVKNSFQNLIEKGDEPKEEDVRKLMKMAPHLEDSLTDWAEDPDEAFEDAFESMYNKDDAIDTFLSVYADFYLRTGGSGKYVENMKELGYDGIVVPSHENDKGAAIYHVVVYNKDGLVISNVEDVEPEE